MPTTRRDVLKLAAAGAASFVAGAGRAPAAEPTKPSPPLRILILGGTGFIGPHQVRYALDARPQAHALQPRPQAEGVAGAGRGAGR